MTQPLARFVGGTIVLEHVTQAETVPTYFRWLNGKWRCEAYHYHILWPWLQKNGIKNDVPRWQNMALRLADGRSPHDYQLKAITAWEQTKWGSIVLPTGAGKTFVALRAIAQTAVSTLIIVPTIDLLHQWYARLQNGFQRPIGVWYGNEKQIEPITVTTYPSAWSNAEMFGNLFQLLVFDEIHHLPAPNWHEFALMNAAPYRLGLTATYPSPHTDLGQDRAQLLEKIVGPICYQKRIDDLTGKQLAEYRTERIRVDLIEDERNEYDQLHRQYMGYVRETRLRESHGAGWWQELNRRSAYEQEARSAKVAELRLKEIVHQARRKLDVVDQLLREHIDLPMLIFTAHNRFAYQIARRHLIPVITHQTKAAERKAFLDGFRAGLYRALVTSKVLNEGVDVPEAKIAVVLGGSANAREYIQRLGRVLRKKGNQEAILYEVIARKTVDEGIAQRRRANVKYQTQ